MFFLLKRLVNCIGWSNHQAFEPTMYKHHSIPKKTVPFDSAILKHNFGCYQYIQLIHFKKLSRTTKIQLQIFGKGCWYDKTFLRRGMRCLLVLWAVFRHSFFLVLLVSFYVRVHFVDNMSQKPCRQTKDL